MKKIRPFTLVERSRARSVSAPKKARRSLAVPAKVSSTSAARAFRNALTSTFSAEPRKSKSSRKGSSRGRSSQIKTVQKDLSRARDVKRVGLLDLGAWVGGLPDLLEKLNAAQKLFTVFEVHASLPSGMRKTKAGMADWLEQETGAALTPSERRSIAGTHVVIDEYVVAAESTRVALGLDFIVGLTGSFVGGYDSDDGEYFWNHFIATRGSSILVSVADVREFSHLAGRPFEAGVGVLMLSSIFVELVSGLGFHKDTGCIFDSNQSRKSLAKTIRELRVDEQCQHKMNPAQLEGLQSALRVIRRMRLTGTT